MTSALSPAWDTKDSTEASPLPSSERVHHMLDGLAAFYATEARARTAAHELQLTLGLGPAQVVVLAPADAGWLRFVQRARQWNRKPPPVGQPQQAGMWAWAGLGAVAGALLAGALLAWAVLFPLEVQLVVVLMAALTGALVGAGSAAAVVRQQPQFRKFDRVVRRRLAAGEWVLVAHDVPWNRQSGVVALLSRHCLDWYGVTSEQGRY